MDLLAHRFHSCSFIKSRRYHTHKTYSIILFFFKEMMNVSNILSICSFVILRESRQKK